jgi:hypothetical protein
MPEVRTIASVAREIKRNEELVERPQPQIGLAPVVQSALFGVGAKSLQNDVAAGLRGALTKRPVVSPELMMQHFELPPQTHVYIAANAAMLDMEQRRADAAAARNKNRDESEHVIDRIIQACRAAIARSSEMLANMWGIPRLPRH